MPFTKGHTINLGKTYSKERVAKASAWHKEPRAKEIYKKRVETFKKLHYKHSEERKLEISLGLIGRPTTQKQIKSLSSRWGEEDKSPLWKGDNVGYGAVHSWIRKKLGNPCKCNSCQKDNLRSRQYHWANISHKYKRELSDWVRLCVKCHSLYDRDLLDICVAF